MNNERHNTGVETGAYGCHYCEEVIPTFDDAKQHRCPNLCRNREHGLFVVRKSSCPKCTTVQPLSDGNQP